MGYFVFKLGYTGFCFRQFRLKLLYEFSLFVDDYRLSFNESG
jgi:hypothetical protein